MKYTRLHLNEEGVRAGPPKRAPRFVVVMALLASLVISGCSPSAPSASAREDIPPRRGGTAWMESAQEPPVLNQHLGVGGMSIVQVVTTAMRSTWVHADDKGVWQPNIATSVPTLENGGVTYTESGGMEIAFKIDPDAVWSDGVPISCKDMRFTWQTMMEPKWNIGSRLGWELISEIECQSQKSVRIILERAFAPYIPTLLDVPPLPAHELAGKNFNTYWNNKITLSSGPFVFDSWSHGDRIILRRNARWWRAGSEGLPYLDRLVIRFVPDASTLKLDLRMEDADLVGLPADTNLPEELSRIGTATYDIRPGAGWENMTFNTRGFPTSDTRVRRAIAYAVDRDAIVDTILRGQVPRLDATLLPYQRPYFHPVFSGYQLDVSKSDQLMKSAGFSKNSSGKWENAKNRTAKLTLTTMTGNPLRFKAIQMLAAQLDESGFETKIVMSKPEVFFGSIIARGNYSIALYSFTQGLDPSQSSVFACSQIAKAPSWAGKNNAKYCRKDIDQKLRAADEELDVAKRAAITHNIAETLASDLPVLPLYQQPDTLAWNKRLRGVRPNAMGRHLWNVDSWWVVDP